MKRIPNLLRTAAVGLAIVVAGSAFMMPQTTAEQNAAQVPHNQKTIASAASTLTPFGAEDGWTPTNGSWTLTNGSMTGQGLTSLKICSDCSAQKPLSSARATFEFVVPSGPEALPALNFGFSNAKATQRIDLKLEGLGGSSSTAMLTKTVNGTTTAINTGATSTKRTLTLEPGSTQTVEILWSSSDVYFRIWDKDSKRPGTPNGGYINQSLDVWPTSTHIETSPGSNVNLTRYGVDLVEAGYPKELTGSTIDPAGWNKFSGTWTPSADGSTLTSSSDGSDAAVARALCSGCTAGSTLTQGTLTASMTVPAAADLKDSTWASQGVMLVAPDTGTRMYAVGLVGSQSQIQVIRSDAGTEKRLGTSQYVWKSGENYTFEMKWNSGSYELRVWPASESRPSAAQVSFTDKTFQPALAGFRQWGVKTASYKDFSLTEEVVVTGDLPPMVNTGTQGLFFPVEKNIVPPISYADAKAKLPTPIADADPLYVDAYNKTWEILFSKNLLAPSSSSPLVKSYVDSGFSPDIMFQWDTLFALQYATYGQGAFDIIAGLDNWYALQSPTGEIRRAYSTGNGQIHGWATGPNGVNPPLFSWVELSSYKKSGDLERVKSVLPALRAYANWVSINQWSQTSDHQLYWNNGNGNGMDNLPTQLGQGGDGANNPVGNVDISSQMVLMRNTLADLEEAAGNHVAAAMDRDWASDLSQRIQKYTWNEADGRFYEVTSAGAHWKVDSLAGFWTLLAKVATPAQVARLASALEDPKSYWTDMVFPTLAKTDPRYDPKGDYWRGGVWAPSTFSTIKGLQLNGAGDLAHRASLRYLDGIANVLDYSGTIWELYAPEKQNDTWINNSYSGAKTGKLIPVVSSGKTLAPGTMSISPGTDETGSVANQSGGSDHMAKFDFAGWTGLAPVALLIEDIIGVELDVPAGSVKWSLARTDRNGVEDLSLGTAGTLSMVAQKRASADADAEVCFSGELRKPMTVSVIVGGVSTGIALAAGKVDKCATVGVDGEVLPPSPTETPTPSATPTVAPTATAQPSSTTPTSAVEVEVSVNGKKTANLAAKQRFDVRVTGALANSSATLTLHSKVVQLGTLQLDGSGGGTWTGEVPSSVQSGSHHVVVAATDASGKAVEVRVPVTISGIESSDQAVPSSPVLGTPEEQKELANTGFDKRVLVLGALVVAAAGAVLSMAHRRSRH